LYVAVDDDVSLHEFVGSSLVLLPFFGSVQQQLKISNRKRPRENKRRLAHRETQSSGKQLIESLTLDCIKLEEF